ncbi:ArsR/SmtB family transcription factor [Bacillus sp. EB01]|uniref:ArsR/SmtB family transcription factor n=1 Tax=Bacillus sp. EB01 TaxID=1347086 RepID=UPI0005C78C83|nr:metalloregulator ArsR/SmtB family transcription factor [Bacillus sp. EB01]
MTKKDTLSLIFTALADPTRRKILTRLAQSEATVKEVSEPFEISAPAISQHIKVLERAGLVERTSKGQWRTLTIRTEPLNEASAWVEKHRSEWNQRFDTLEEHLNTMTKKEEQ